MVSGEPSDVLHAQSQRRVRHRIVLRVAALLGLSLMCVVFPQIGEHRFMMAAVLVATTAVPVLLPRVVDPKNWMTAQSSFDVIATISLIWLVPSVWAAGLVIVVASPAASSALLGRRNYLVLESIGLAGLASSALVLGVEAWVVPFGVASLMMPLVASYVDVFLAQERGAVAQLQDVAESADVILWEIDPTTGRLVAVSGRIEDILGYTRSSLPEDVRLLFHPDDVAALWRVPRDVGGWSEGRCRMRHADGSWVSLQLSFRTVGTGPMRVVRGVAVDVTELVELAETDELTGLANRAVVNRHLDEQLASGETTVLMMMDLDRFKEVNDTLGHHSGDRFLCEIAQRLDAEVPADQLIARIGGDEFAFVISGPDAMDLAVDVARRAGSACERPVKLDGLDFAGSSSIGIAASPQHGNTAGELFRRADMAMYAAKRAGTAFRTYDSDTQGPTIDRLTLSGEVEGALERGELRLWFQPKIDLDSGEIAGAEGLLRWHHPTRGVLRPGSFLDVVEISRHFALLTSELVSQATAMLATTDSSGIHVSVNVSVRNLVDIEFADHVVDTLDSAGVDPSRLVLEITEREITSERTNVTRALGRLRAAGVGLSIDDFGTGHSSLLRLHDLPVTELKIDRRFVADLGHNREASIIVRGVIDLGRRLGHTIVAEGVERPYEVDLLRSFGCELAQGFLWSEAVPFDEFVAMLASPEPEPRLERIGDV